ncbi:MAG: hypothetical protein MN733_02635 [Nitrososphaera sp.]|nr:hypothetical protein [Nitrososphaera sp.]
MRPETRRQVQRILANRVNNRFPIALIVPNSGVIHQAHYSFEWTDIALHDYIGHIISMPEGPSLFLLEVETIYGSSPEVVIFGKFVLHRDDSRSLRSFVSRGLTLKQKDVCCIFKPRIANAAK